MIAAALACLGCGAGSTGVKGQKISLSAGLARNVTLDNAVHYAKAIATHRKETLAQLDVNLKV